MKLRTPIETTTLVKYEAARHALAEAHRIDEVKSIRDKMLAIQEYGRRAKDETLVTMATQIKCRAEWRAGELLREMKESRQRKMHGNPGDRSESKRVDSLPALKDLGITKDQSSQWQKIATIPESKFEAALVEAVHEGSRISTKTLVAMAKKKTKPGSRLPQDESAGLAARDARRVCAKKMIEAGFTKLGVNDALHRDVKRVLLTLAEKMK